MMFHILTCKIRGQTKYSLHPFQLTDRGDQNHAVRLQVKGWTHCITKITWQGLGYYGPPSTSIPIFNNLPPRKSL